MLVFASAQLRIEGVHPSHQLLPLLPVHAEPLLPWHQLSILHTAQQTGRMTARRQ